MDPEALSQINKLRSSLGLPLLGNAEAPSETEGPKFKEHTQSDSEEEPASTLETREAAGYENFKKLQDEEKRRVEREQRKKAIQRARENAARFERIEGKGLGEADENEQDTRSWLKSQKKRQKEIERQRTKKLEEELAEREKEAVIQYTSADLAGVQVAHEVGDFDDGINDQILTLQDQEIGKDDDSDHADVLESADIVARDKLKEKQDLKKKIRYDVHEEDTGEKGLLSQYDDKKRKAFTLDGYGNSVEEREAKRQQIGEKLKNTVSLDILKADPISDYQEIKIKKPKKAKKKNLRQKETDDDIFPSNDTNGDAMQIDEPQAQVPKPKADTSYNDDEDLASALTFSRRAALKKKKMKTEDLIKQMEEDEVSSNVEGGMTLDDTTTFLDNLEARPREEESQTIHKSIESPEPEIQETNGDEPMEESNEAYTMVEGDEEALLEHLRREQATHTPEVPASTGLEEEQSLSGGLGATLNLLRSRGMVKTANDPGDRNALYRDRQKFIAEARLREFDNEARARAQRERDRASGKMSGMSMREREEHARWANEQRAQQSSIQAAAAFNKEYKPDVSIKYVDDDGREMNQKEAFKQLSHQFHGKASGKQKTEKHLKKVADERRREAKSVLDSSGDDNRGMQRAAGNMGKRDKVAGVRLA